MYGTKNADCFFSVLLLLLLSVGYLRNQKENEKKNIKNNENEILHTHAPNGTEKETDSNDEREWNESEHVM